MSKRLPILLSLLLLSAVTVKPLEAQTEMKATPPNGAPTEVSLPAGDPRPAFNFENKTGAEICDFVITMTVGGNNLRGVVVTDPRVWPSPGGGAPPPVPDYDVDDDGNGQLIPGEGANNAAGEGPTPLTHGDNIRPVPLTRILRVEENGRDQCVGRNHNFSITLDFDGPPVAGDKITIQPTNSVGSNMYAWAGPIDQEQTFAMATAMQLVPALSVTMTQSGAMVSGIRLVTRTPGVTIASVRTVPLGEFDASAGMVRFPTPVSAAEGIQVDATLSAMGTLAIAAVLTSDEGTKPGGISMMWLVAIGVAVILVAVFLMSRRRTA